METVNGGSRPLSFLAQRALDNLRAHVSQRVYTPYKQRVLTAAVGAETGAMSCIVQG